MDDFDFKESLMSKHASPIDHIKRIAEPAVKYISENRHEAGGAVVGGILAGVGTYLASRKGADGTSSDQKFTDDLVARTSKATGFGGELLHLAAKTSKGVADLAAKYPVAAANIAAPTGAAIGANLVKALLK